MAGTSSWHHIGYCVDVMKRIQPESVLDVGAGFGRWGMLVREFCEVWEGRYFPKDWAIRVDAVEVFEQNICEYHRGFYNTIAAADAATWLTPERCDYDLIILGDVLEHFERQTAERLLAQCIGGARYVLLSIPIGEDFEQPAKYGNPHERHKSFWHVHELARAELRHQRVFRDFRGRPFGVFVFSREDPKGVAERLFSCYEQAVDTPLEVHELAQRVAGLQHELRAIRSSRSWQLTERVRRNLGYRAVRWLAKRALGRG